MYNKILVPLDGSELAECVFPHVESIAGGCGVKSVVFVRVVEPFRAPANYYAEGLSAEAVKRIDDDNIAAAEKYMKDITARIKLNGAAAQTEILRGTAAESIAEYASKNSVDLIAIATHGRSGITRWAWGSVADRVLRASCVPVLMVKAPGCVPGIY